MLDIGFLNSGIISGRIFESSMFVRMLLFSCIGYLCGSFLSAYYIPKWICKVDITACSGDGNPGTANAFKNAGFECGIFVLITELSKGFLPVHMALRYMDMRSLWFVPVLVAPVIGHAHSMFYGFKGGKAIAPSFGVLLGIFPDLIPAALLAFFYIFFSLIIKIAPHWKRSIVTYISWFVSLIITYRVRSVCIAGAIISSVVVHKHLISKE